MRAPPAVVPVATPRESASTRLFFLIAIGGTFVLQLPAALAKLGLLPGPVESYMGPLALGTFAPLVGAIVASRYEGGREGLRAFFRSFRPRGVGIGWYVVALFLVPLVYVAGAAVYRVAGGESPIAWWYPPSQPPQIAAVVMIPLLEEPGWRGFAMPRLDRRFGAIGASLVLGVLWALWHTAMFIVQGTTPLTFALATVNIVAGAFSFTWLYRRTSGSLPIAIVAHAGAHLNNPTHSLATGDVTAFVVYTIAVVVAACALVLFDRAAFSPRRDRAAA